VEQQLRAEGWTRLTATKEQVHRGSYRPGQRPAHPAESSSEPSLVDRYAAANQTCRDIAQKVGARNCDENPEWRAAEREAEHLWTQARDAGHTVDELMAASRVTT